MMPVTPLADSVERLASTFKTITPEEAERRQRAAQERAAHDREVKAKTYLDASRAPLRHRETVIEDVPAWTATFLKLKAKCGTGFLMALIGIRGNGKTQLAVELIRSLAESNINSRFCSAMEFFMEVKAGYRNDSKAEKDVIAEFCKPKLLVMDEIGQRADSDWEKRLLYEMINRRYNEMLDTLLISNQEEAQFVQAIGTSIVSRMNETGGLIKCDWETMR